MKEYRVRYWGLDGGDEFMEFDTMEQAREFYDSLDGLAEIQKHDAAKHVYEMVLPPEFEY